jgi:hypothetical protein
VAVELDKLHLQVQRVQQTQAAVAAVARLLEQPMVELAGQG